MSINPEHVRNILKGTKKYEYRRKVARQDVTSLVIYETAPVQRVVAEVEILEVLTDSPKLLWKATKGQSGISKKFFDGYFQGRTTAHAYKLGKVVVYDTPKRLEDFGLTFAPQSFVYLS